MVFEQLGKPQVEKVRIGSMLWDIWDG